MSDKGADKASGAAAPYRVLARKYRPATFAGLIGQEGMVRTLTNAFKSGRIAQAYMLTGVRGVGKTTTARIIARALNYSVPGKADAPTVDMPEFGEHCAAIMESRHVDVVELDAASHTGVDNMRDLIERARYKPVSARYKVYIIDEVHMLSTAAFNALLKTLEEPPEHVKFVFATTEIRKVPITVLSRCQRFDLRRIDASMLASYLADILKKEKVKADKEALALVARAAEGSARDALSIIDQAIAHASGAITAEQVRDMLGLVDRSRVIALFKSLMQGDVAAALAEFKAQYDSGADPVTILADLAAFSHFVTRVKFVPDAADDPALAEAERTEGKALSETLDLRILTRAWQMLLKGMDEAARAPQPFAAAEMVLVRLAHAAELPTPDEVVRAAREGQGAGSAPAPRARAPEAATTPGNGGSAQALRRPDPVAEPDAPHDETAPIARFEDIVELAARHRDLPLKVMLEQKVRPVSLEPGRLVISVDDDAPQNLASDLARRLQDWTGRRWMIAIAGERSGETIAEKTKAAQQARFAEAAQDEAVRRVLSQFPGAEIVAVRDTMLEDDASGEAEKDTE